MKREFKDIFVELLQNKGISAYRMSADTGISEQLLSHWKSGRRVPASDSLIMIADYLNVSIDYLLGRINQHWICDVCGRIIDNPEKGYVVWKYGNNGAEEGHFEYKILHPNRRLNEHEKKHGCDNDPTYIYSSSLVDFIGDIGLVKLFAMLDPGPFHRDEYRERIKNIRDFLELFRRVQLPYYEEARFYFEEARIDGYLEGANEIFMYLPSTLKNIIEKYKS